MQIIPIDSFTTLFEHVAQGALLLTPNQRLCAWLSQKYGTYRSKEHSVWETPLIYTYNTWIAELWNMDPDLPSLLNDNQTTFLWLHLIQESDASFFNLQEISTLIKNAWTLCCQWDVPISGSLWEENRDLEFFCVLTKQYKQFLESNTCIDLGSVPNAIIEAYDRFHLRLPKQVILFGFDSLTPQLSALLNTLERHAIALYQYVAPPLASSVLRMSCISPEAEWEEVLRWMRQGLLEKKSMGCVLPQLGTLRKQVEKSMREHFSPELYNISLGSPFSDYPMIACALKILSLRADLPEWFTFSYVLTTPYIGDLILDFFKHTHFHARLQEKTSLHISFKTFLNHLKAESFPLAQKLEALNVLPLDGKKQPGQWVSCFIELLRIMGWPGPRTENSLEFQLRTRFQRSLEEYAFLDRVIPRVSYSDAYHLFARQLHQTIFQPESRPNAPIQILGLLEGSGLNFDSVWVMDLGSDIFPARPSPNPFIPKVLQRQLGMPHASFQRELEFARPLLQRLNQSAPNVTLSYPQKKGDLLIAPSPLIKDFKEILSVKDRTPSTSFEPEIILETIADPLFVPLGEEALKGGVQILEDQSLCPFRGFAKHRLKARGLKDLLFGLSDAERGIIEHRTFDHFWALTQSHAHLIAYTEAALESVVASAIQYALAPFQQQKPDLLTDLFYELEAGRLRALLLAWLPHERKRPPFTVVQIEDKQTVSLADLALKIRVDRVDCLENGEKIVIDYKTGTPAISAWFGERPEAPQLPLYTLMDPMITGLAFAQLKHAELAWKGMGAYDMGISGIEPIDKRSGSHSDWDPQCAFWREHLERLALEVKQGYAAVTPQNNAVCTRCDLHGLCRVKDRKSL